MNAPPLFDILPGWHYIVSGGSNTDVHLRPVVKYGVAIDTPALDFSEDIFLPTEFFHVGVERFFAPRAKLHRSSQAPATHSGWLLVAVRDGGGDPVIAVGNGGYTLVAPAVIPITASFEQGEELIHFRQRFDVPGPEELATVVVFFQIVLDDGTGGLAYSSVAGAALQPSAVDPLLRFAGGQNAAARGGGPTMAQWQQRATAAFRDPVVRGKVREWLGPHRDPGLSQRILRRMGGVKR